jgi:glycosyltransferase involved in cell wall biosynthesis
LFKIAHVFTTFYAGPGALERTFAIAADQKQRGWWVEFITGHDASPELLQKKQQEGFPVVQIDSLRKYPDPPQDIKALVEMVDLFKQKKYDVVHTHWAKPGTLGRLAARFAKVKIIVRSAYGTTFAPGLPRGLRFFFWSLEKLLATFTHQFIFNGKELQEMHIRAGICNTLNSQVIYGGRDLSAFVKAALLPEEERRARKQSFGIGPQTPLIGYVARLVPIKGHIYAVRALRELKSQGNPVKLMFVGGVRLPSEQIFKEKLVKKAKELGLEEEIIFIDWQTNPAKYYSLFDIFVFPSLLEGLPGAILEARVADLPIVAFDCGGVREILGDNGNLVPVRDVAGLTRALAKEIARLPETRRRRGQDLAEVLRLQEVFSIDRMVARTAQLYERLLADPKNLRSRQE